MVTVAVILQLILGFMEVIRIYKNKNVCIKWQNIEMWLKYRFNGELQSTTSSTRTDSMTAAARTSLKHGLINVKSALIALQNEMMKWLHL